MIEESWEILEESGHVLDKAGRNAGLKINVEKTKTMTFGSEEERNSKLRMKRSRM